MSKKRIEVREDVYFIDEKIFGDKEEHYYNVECHNGWGIGTLADEEDKAAPKKIRVKYPKRADVLKDKSLVKEIVDYFEVSNISYGDIMAYMCEIDSICPGDHLLDMVLKSM